MATAYIGIGSNIEPEMHIRRALLRLACTEKITGIATFYRTSALKRPDDPIFLNGVARLETALGPFELKNELKEIEYKEGRVRSADAYAPRTIDLDVLLYDDQIIDDDRLIVPDPDITERNFIARPLFELAPDLVLPGTGEAIRTAAAKLPENGMKPHDAFTRTVRKELKI